MRVLVTGSNGLLGTKLLDLLASAPGVQPLGVSRGPCAPAHLGRVPFWQLDLTEPTAVDAAFADARPDVVIHTAAMTDVDGCERQPALAWRANVEATRYVATAAARHHARMIHLSTEYVFDGSSGPYREDDLPNPLGVYGRTKLESERVVLQIAPGAAVARTTILFGTAPHVRPDFVAWLVRRLRAGEPAHVVTDQVGSPTLADNLAQMVWALAGDPGAQGIYHTVGASVLDRFQLALLVAETFELDVRLLRPTDTRSLAQAAARPLRAGLLTDRFRARFPGVPVLTAREALQALRRQLEGPAEQAPAGVAGNTPRHAAVGRA